MFNRIVPLLLLVTLLIQGCVFPQDLGENVHREMVKEEGTGVIVERSGKKKIELTSPLSVRVYAEVDQQETTKRYYQNVLVRSKARPKEFPLWDAWTKLLLSTTVIPLFLKDYWIMGSYLGPNCRLEPEACTIENARSVLSRDYIVEDGVRSTREQRQDLPQSDRVSLFINGLYKGDLRISSANVATVDLHAFPELNALHKPLKLTFKYHDAFAHSLLSPEEVERILEQGAPAMVPAESR